MKVVESYSQNIWACVTELYDWSLMNKFNTNTV